MPVDPRDRNYHFSSVMIPVTEDPAASVRRTARAVVLVEAAPALIAHEADIIRHMNEDHQDALDACAQGLLGLAGTGWHLTGIDPKGADLRHRSRTARLTFRQPVSDVESARAGLARLARSRLPTASQSAEAPV